MKRTRLLDNTERLDRSTRKLEQGYRIAVETGMFLLCGFCVCVFFCWVFFLFCFFCTTDSNVGLLVTKELILPVVGKLST